MQGQQLTALRLPAIILMLLTGCHAADPAPGPPQQVTVASGNQQQAAVGSALPVSPVIRVKDSRGDALPGVSVKFVVTGGGGHIQGDSVVTDLSGDASVAVWILGTVPGTNTIQASVVGSTVGTSITATAVPGVPAALRVVGSQLFTAMAQQVISPAPTVQVLDAYTNVIPGATITFTVTSTLGTVAGGTVVTNAQGQAQVGNWTLGAAAGPNRLTASTSNGLTVVFAATGLIGNPVMTATSPLTQVGFQNFPVAAVPRVKVTDGFGTPLANVSVVFATTGGDGTLLGTQITTGSDGVAAASDWRLGSSGASTVVASMPNFTGPQVTFGATGGPTPFTIDVRFLTTMSADSRDAFVSAARRWMQVIVGDIPDQPLTLATNTCATGQPAINETVDDVIIYASVVAIDGPGNVLGSAGPCVRRTPSNLTVVGTMRFDQDDLALLNNTNRLVPTIIHEMGHVLGFGTSWPAAVTQDLGSADPIYVGPEAMSLWAPFATALLYNGRPIPLENTGGSGTRDAHWREAVFHTEMMTGFIEGTGVAMPISRLTIATFKDLGYVVNYGAADVFVGNVFGSPLAVLGIPVPLNDEVFRANYEVGLDGRPHRIN